MKGQVNFPARPQFVCELVRRTVFRAPLDSSQLGKDHQTILYVWMPDQPIPDEPGLASLVFKCVSFLWSKSVILVLLSSVFLADNPLRMVTGTQNPQLMSEMRGVLWESHLLVVQFANSLLPHPRLRALLRPSSSAHPLPFIQIAFTWTCGHVPSSLILNLSTEPQTSQSIWKWNYPDVFTDVTNGQQDANAKKISSPHMGVSVCKWDQEKKNDPMHTNSWWKGFFFTLVARISLFKNLKFEFSSKIDVWWLFNCC